MQIIEKENTIVYKNITSFDPRQTFNCGQCFRWDVYEKGFRGFAGEYLCYVWVEDGNLYIKSLTSVNDIKAFADFMHHYLALDVDYDAIKEKFSADPVMKDAIAYSQGIRVMNQPFFETLITFIISQNNNIPRIKKIVDALSATYGTKVGDVYAFPTAEQLADVTQEDFAELRVGFRAKYLTDAMDKIKNGVITEQAIRTMDYDTAAKYLMQIKGVGPKVADCVLLFSCEKYESLPKDVWIKRALAELFPDGLPQCIQGLEGIAQQYIFNYARFNLEK